MDRVNRREINLYEDAKAGLRSLIQQTASVFVGFLILLLMTGGAPSGIAVSLSFCFGVAFVAWSEQTRLRNLRSANREVVKELAQENQSKDLYRGASYSWGRKAEISNSRFVKQRILVVPPNREMRPDLSSSKLYRRNFRKRS